MEMKSGLSWMCLFQEARESRNVVFCLPLTALRQMATATITLAAGKVESNEFALTNVVYLNPVDHEKLFGKRAETLELQYVKLPQGRVFAAT